MGSWSVMVPLYDEDVIYALKTDEVAKEVRVLAFGGGVGGGLSGLRARAGQCLWVVRQGAPLCKALVARLARLCRVPCATLLLQLGLRKKHMNDLMTEGDEGISAIEYLKVGQHQHLPARPAPSPLPLRGHQLRRNCCHGLPAAC